MYYIIIILLYYVMLHIMFELILINNIKYKITEFCNKSKKQYVFSNQICKCLKFRALLIINVIIVIVVITGIIHRNIKNAN